MNARIVWIKDKEYDEGETVELGEWNSNTIEFEEPDLPELYYKAVLLPIEGEE